MSRPATWSYNTSIETTSLAPERNLNTARRAFGSRTQTHVLTATIRHTQHAPRHTRLRAHPHQCEATSPSGPPFSSHQCADPVPIALHVWHLAPLGGRVV